MDMPQTIDASPRLHQRIAEAHAAHCRRAMQLAREHVVECIESECLAAGARTPDGTQWWDTRPMLDPHEHASEVIDMAQAALQYAIDYRIAFRHLVSPHLVRIATRSY